MLLIVCTLSFGMCHHSFLLRASFVVLVAWRIIHFLLLINNQLNQCQKAVSWTTSSRHFQTSAVLVLCVAVAPSYAELDFDSVGGIVCDVRLLCFSHVISVLGPLLGTFLMKVRQQQSASTLTQLCTSCSGNSKSEESRLEKIVKRHLMTILAWQIPPLGRSGSVERSDGWQCVICLAASHDENDEIDENDVGKKQEPGTDEGVDEEKDEGVDEENATQELPCGHRFHVPCIAQWFEKETASLCPLCKANVTHGAIQRLFKKEESEEEMSSVSIELEVLV